MTKSLNFTDGDGVDGDIRFVDNGIYLLVIDIDDDDTDTSGLGLTRAQALELRDALNEYDLEPPSRWSEGDRVLIESLTGTGYSLIERDASGRWHFVKENGIIGNVYSGGDASVEEWVDGTISHAREGRSRVTVLQQKNKEA